MRSAVLEATMEALLEHGADALSVADIAQRAGVHETSIYRRWGTKANVALEAVLDRTESDIPAPDTGSLRGDLSALLHGTAAFVRTPLGELLLRMALRQDLAEYEAAREVFWTSRFAVGTAVLDRAEARGELRKGVDRHLAFEALMGPLYMRLLLTREPLDDAFLDDTVEMILTGIAAGRPPQR